MTSLLAISVRLLTRRYHGREWPPSPARLFQALVAGAKTGSALQRWTEAETGALQWLEALPPPRIHARRATPGASYRIFVPNNSLSKGQSTKTAKTVSPLLLDGQTEGLLDVVYAWDIESPTDAKRHLPALDSICASLHALGWGLDLATAICEILDQPANYPDLDLYLPGASGGQILQCHTPGFLRHLEECHHAFTHRETKQGIDPFTRPTRFSEVRYRKAMDFQPRRHLCYQLTAIQGGAFSVRWDQAMLLSGQLRHLAARALLDEECSKLWVDSYVSGHIQTGDANQRLSYVPLPSIGFRHSDGAIRRIMLVEPPGAATTSDAEAMDLLAIKLIGTALKPEKSEPVARLETIADASKVLPFYLREARVWRSVTPIILHGHNTSRGQLSVDKTARLLHQAFAESGFSEDLVDSITFQAAPWWAGCESASAIQVPVHLKHWPRLHVQVTFRKPVPGPVLAGIGRHNGLGLFAGIS